jgi:hypothetical protein
MKESDLLLQLVHWCYKRSKRTSEGNHQRQVCHGLDTCIGYSLKFGTCASDAVAPVAEDKAENPLLINTNNTPSSGTVIDIAFRNIASASYRSFTHVFRGSRIYDRE